MDTVRFANHPVVIGRSVRTMLPDWMKLATVDVECAEADQAAATDIIFQRALDVRRPHGSSCGLPFELPPVTRITGDRVGRVDCIGRVETATPLIESSSVMVREKATRSFRLLAEVEGQVEGRQIIGESCASSLRSVRHVRDTRTGGASR